MACGTNNGLAANLSTYTIASTKIRLLCIYEVTFFENKAKNTFLGMIRQNRDPEIKFIVSDNNICCIE